MWLCKWNDHYRLRPFFRQNTEATAILIKALVLFDRGLGLIACVMPTFLLFESCKRLGMAQISSSQTVIAAI